MVILGSLATAISGLLLFVPAGVPGLIVSRLFLGAGEGAVYTAGSAWIVDLAPPDRRGRIIGLYGLAIWGGLALGPPIGELILQAASFEAVWAFATAAPLVGALVAMRIPERFQPRAGLDYERSLLAHEALRPGLGSRSRSSATPRWRPSSSCTSTSARWVTARRCSQPSPPP